MSRGRRFAKQLAASLGGERAAGAGRDVRGAIDRAHNGLVSGWLECDACGPDSPPSLVLEIDGRTIDADTQPVPRPELSHGQGAVFRFAPVAGTRNPDVRVSCRDHSATGIEQRATDWDVRALAAFENSRWPVLSGWVAVLDSGRTVPTLWWGSEQSAPLVADVSRPEVQDYLGKQGVAGFHVNLAAIDGYALTDETPVQIRFGTDVLASTHVRDSPVESARGCVAEVDRSHIPDPPYGNLDDRLRSHPERLLGDSWRDVLVELGLDPESDPVIGQWGRLFSERGAPAADAAIGVLERMSDSIGVPHCSLAPQTDVPEAGNRERDTVEHPKSETDAKVCIAGLVRHRSGLGQNAVRSRQALELAGIHACAESFFPQAGGWNPRLAGVPESVRALADHAVLLHVPVDRTLDSLAAQPALMASDRLIAYFMWEVGVVPRWFIRSLDVVDEIWTATEFVAQAFRAVTDTPVTVVGHAVEVGEIEKVPRHELGVAEDDFLVHFSFDANSTVARKNPAAVIDAFQQAFEGDPSARLAIKVRNMQQAQYLAIQGDRHAREFLRRLGDDESIIVISDEWSYPRTLGLIEAADCYLSLHRSEGFGYALAESMLLGTPVIATGYSGNTEFMDSADLVDFELVDLEPGDYFYWEPGMQWAQADVEQAAAALQNVRGEQRGPRSGSRPASIFDITRLGDSYVSALRAGDSL